MFCPKCSNDKFTKSGKAASGRVRYICTSCQSRTTSPLRNLPTLLPKTRITPLKKLKRFMITSAVCDTPVNSDAFETMLTWCEVNNGTLLVVPTVYKNPDLSNRGQMVDSTWWPKEVMPYICNVDFTINKNLAIKAGTSIQHTVAEPLRGFASAGTMQSEIYAHAQIQMEMVATPKDAAPKMLITTGSVSQKNYGKSVRAKKAQHHHATSALIVEIQGDKFWIRQFHFDGAGAYDLDNYYMPDSYEVGHNVEAIVYGDTHVRALRPEIEALFETTRSILSPEMNIFHDVHDHHAGSHHAQGDVISHMLDPTLVNVRDELDMAVAWLDKQHNPHIVDSNHDRHLNQWFNRFKPANDPVNAPLYFELAEMLRVNKEGNLFKLYCDRYCKQTIKFINCNNKFMVAGVDCSQHGDRGPNGSRGTAKSLTKAGLKMVIGHSHSPGIQKNVYQVGTSTMNLEYANGLSSWANAHCIIYKNGKRSLFFIIEDKLSPMMRG